MSTKLLASFFLLFAAAIPSHAQLDSSVTHFQDLPKKYLSTIESKSKKYSSRITSKTENTLTKLARWENKIKTLLQKASPEAANRLFAPGQMSFNQALQEYRKGQTVVAGYKAGYDKYRDDLSTQLKYLEEKKELLDKKYLQPLAQSKAVVGAMEEDAKNTEAMQKFIKERKKQLLQEAITQLGKNKYLQKINKETFYYTETLRNYKEIFNDSKKAEETALTLLNKIPAFQKFMRENGMLASLFRVPDNYGSAQSLAGLQTRASVNSLIQTRIAAGGPNALAEVQSNLQQAQSQLTQLKNKILEAGGGSSDMELPDFKPNMQKTKTLKQRLEYGFDLQPVKSNSFLPASANLGLSIGYKINDKSTAGLGISYKLGMGSIEKIRLTHEGIGLRSFIDWKLKKQFFVSGGFEMNHNTSFKNIAGLQDANAWQQSGLVGISKKIAFKTKFFKGSSILLLYDILHNQYIPVNRPLQFRIGYKF